MNINITKNRYFKILTAFLTFITCYTLLSLINASNASPAAANEQPAVVNEVSNIDISVSQATSSGGTASIHVVTDKNISDTNQELKLYDNADNSLIETRTSSSSNTFIVNSPINGYKQYYVKVDNVRSSTISVNNFNSGWEISLTPTVKEFITTGPSPQISIGLNQAINTQNYYGIYLVEDATGDIEYKNKTSSLLSISVNIDKFFETTNKTYTAYIAKYDSSVTNLSQLQDIEVASTTNTEISWISFTLEASISAAEFSTNDPTPTITASSNQNVYESDSYEYFFVDLNTNEVFYKSRGSSTYSTVSHKKAIPRFYTGDVGTYVVYIAELNSAFPGDNKSELENIVAISNSVSTSRVSWEVEATISAEVFETSDPTPTVTAYTNQSVYDTDDNYYYYLVDETEGKIIRKTRGSSSQNNSLKMNLNRFYTGDEHLYRVYVASKKDASGSYISVGDAPSVLYDIQGASESVTLSRATWDIEADISSEIFETSDPTPTVTAYTNQSVYDANGYYYYYLVDETEGKIIRKTRGSSSQNNSLKMNLNRFYTGGKHIYSVYVASVNNSTGASIGVGDSVSDLYDIQTVSSTLETKRAPWTITSEISLNVFSTQDSTPTVTAYTNQSIYDTDNNYYYYLVDETESKIIRKTRGSSSQNNSLKMNLNRFYTGEGHHYRTYVASVKNSTGASIRVGDSVSDLYDIQTVSNSMFTERQSWNVEMEIINIDYYENIEFDYSDDTIRETIQISTLGQTVYRTDGNYSVYILGNGEIKKLYTGSDLTDTTTFIMPAHSRYENIAYQAVVAKKDYSADYGYELEDIQAISSTWNSLIELEDIPMEELTMGYNPSTGTCNIQCYGDPVNSINGELFDNSTDLQANSPINLSFSRSYSSMNSEHLGELGYGWSANTFMNIYTQETTPLSDAEKIYVIQENGSPISFIKTSQDSYSASQHIQATLELDENNNFVLTRNSTGLKFTFDDQTGKILQIEDRNSNTLTYQYNTSEQLTSITSSNGNSINIIWNSDNLISQVSSQGETVSYTYDTNKNLTSVNYSQIGNIETYTYDNEHKILTSTNTDNGTYTNVYNNTGQVEEQTDPQGNITTFSYDTNNGEKTTTITLPNGQIVKENYNTNNQIKERIEAYGTTLERKTSYEYDKRNNISKITDAENYETTYTYDFAGNITTITNPLGNQTQITYNTLNLPLTITDANGGTYTYTYDISGNLLTETTPEGNQTQYGYTNSGMRETITNPSQAQQQNPQQTAISYNSIGLPETITSPNGKTIDLTYNTNYQTETITDTSSLTTQAIYDTNNRLIGYNYPTGTSTTSAYNTAGRISSETDELGNTISYSYNNKGQIVSATDNTETITYTYSSMGAINTITTSTGLTETFEYDLLGRITASIDTRGNENTYTYDLKDNLLTQTDALNLTTSYTYDGVGKIITNTQPNNGTTTYIYDKIGQLKTITDPLNNETTYTYDKDGNIIQITHPDLTATQYEYNQDGLITKYVDAAGEEKTYTYNTEGQPTTITEKDSSQTTNTYNSIGQTSSTIFPDGTEKQYEYDQYNNLWKTSHDNWTTIDEEYLYDSYGRLTSVTNPTETIEYEYDQYSNITRRGPPAGSGNSYLYTYDTLNRLASITDPHNNLTEYTYNHHSDLTETKVNGNTEITSTYDTYGRITTNTYGNNTQTTYTYNNYSQLNTKTTKDDSSNTIYEQNRDYDLNGRVETDNLQQKDFSLSNLANTDNQYTYNALGQLNTATILDNITSQTQTHNYSFDTQGKILTDRNNNYTYNNNQKQQLAQLTDPSTANLTINYTYHPSGSRATQTQTLTNQTTLDTTELNTEYTYNHLQELTNWTQNNTINNPATPQTSEFETTHIDYTYNSEGLLSSRTEKTGQQTTQTGETPNPTLTTNSIIEYEWDTNNHIPRLTNDTTNTYYYQPNSYIPFLQQNNTTQELTYLHADMLGSIIATTDETSSTTASYSYDEYGNTLTDSDTGNPTTQFKYAGQYQDPTTQLYYNRARWYDPQTASFISIDPALQLTDEPYSYASGNPISLTDPTGLMSTIEGIWAWATDNPAEATIGVVGFIGSAACTMMTAGGCLIGASVISGTTSLAHYAVSENCHTWQGALTSFGFGATSSFAGAGVGKIFSATPIGGSISRTSSVLDIHLKSSSINFKQNFKTIIKSDDGCVGLGCGVTSVKAHSIKNKDNSVDIVLYYKEGWSIKQKDSAKIKIKGYNDFIQNGGVLSYQGKIKRNTYLTSKYRKDNNVSSELDIDHKIDLVIGGQDITANMQDLNPSVNRSIGSQLRNALSGYNKGTVIRNVSIKERP